MTTDNGIKKKGPLIRGDLFMELDEEDMPASGKALQYGFSMLGGRLTGKLNILQCRHWISFEARIQFLSSAMAVGKIHFKFSLLAWKGGNT